MFSFQFCSIVDPQALHHMRTWPPGPAKNPVSWLMKACAAGSMSSCVEFTWE